MRRANFLSAGLPFNSALNKNRQILVLDLPVFHRARIRREPVPADRTATAKFSVRSRYRDVPVVAYAYLGTCALEVSAIHLRQYAGL